MPRPTFDDARRDLVDGLARRGIRDEAVLAAVRSVPRERFVPDHLVGRAHEDIPLPIGRGQTISQPWIVARMAEAVGLRPHHRVLDVGTGSGYAAAIAAHLAGEVHGIERLPELARRAQDLLDDLGLAVRVHVGDGTRGLPEHAPFDAIIVAAATPDVPPALVEQLADDGRMVIPVGAPAGDQELQLFTRRGSRVEVQRLLRVRFVPLTADEHPG